MGCAIGLVWSLGARAESGPPAVPCPVPHAVAARTASATQPWLARASRLGPSRAGKQFATQNETLALPIYVNRRGELSLIGPTGLIRDSRRIRLDLNPDADRALSLRIIW